MIPGKQPPALTLIGIRLDASKQAVNMLVLQTHCFTNYLAWDGLFQGVDGYGDLSGGLPKFINISFWPFS